MWAQSKKFRTVSHIVGVYHFHDDQAEYLANSFHNKAMTEFIGDGREMRHVFQQTAAKEPAARHIENALQLFSAENPVHTAAE